MSKCADCGFSPIVYEDDDQDYTCYRCAYQSLHFRSDKKIAALTERIEKLKKTGANLVRVIEAATVIETMFVMGNRKDKSFQEVEQIVGAKNILKAELAADDKAKGEG